MNLPGYSPDFNADEAIWGTGAREEATGNLCLGTKALVHLRVGTSSGLPAGRRGEAPLPDGPALKGRSTS